MLHSSIWRLAKAQHGVVTRTQLLAARLSATRPSGIASRPAGCISRRRGVYAVGSPWLSRHGEWMVAILACGAWRCAQPRERGVALGHAVRRRGAHRCHGAAAGPPARGGRAHTAPRPHRRSDMTERHGVPVTSPALTLVDLAARLERDPLEAAVNEADKLDLIDPEGLRVALERFAGWRGAPALRATLDRRTFTLTDSELERRFLPLARRAGLATPADPSARQRFRVDFFWPELGLVVETDGLRYHRTPQSAGARPGARPSAHGRRAHPAALHPRPGRVRAAPRGRDAHGSPAAPRGRKSRIVED